MTVNMINLTPGMKLPKKRLFVIWGWVRRAKKRFSHQPMY
jgi:hypothetical protein